MTALEDNQRLPVTESQWRERHRSVDNKLAVIDDRLLRQDDMLRDIAVMVGRMDVTLAAHVLASADQEQRIRGLERHRNWFAGVLAAAGVSGTTIAATWGKIREAVSVFS